MGVLVAELRVLDEEATPLSDGTPTGIWWYHRYLQGTGPSPKSYRNEEKLFGALVSRLVARGVETKPEQYYPKHPARKRNQRCDLVLRWPGLGMVWIEVKGAWRHQDSRGLLPNRSYTKHLHAAAEDASKLDRVDRAKADYVGLLLIGFDQSNDPIAVQEIDIVRAIARPPQWREQFATWNDTHRLSGAVKVWLWTRKVTAPAADLERAFPTLK